MTEHATISPSITPLLLSEQERDLLAALLDASVVAAGAQRLHVLASLRARLACGGDPILACIHAPDGRVTEVEANAPITCIALDVDSGDQIVWTPTGPIVADIAELAAVVRPDRVTQTLEQARATVQSGADIALFVSRDDRLIAARRIDSADDLAASVQDIVNVDPVHAGASLTARAVRVRHRTPEVLWVTEVVAPQADAMMS